MTLLVTIAFIILDFITGIIKALKNKAFSSSIMREGLFHKLGFICALVLAVLCDYGQGYIDLGISIPLTGLICSYIVICEIGSIIENLGEINPNLISSKLKSFFTKLNNGGLMK